MHEEFRPANPPFPTFCPLVEENASDTVKDIYDPAELDNVYAITSKDIYHPNLFQFSMPSIVYTEADETKSAVRDKSHAKTAKARKV
jgi:hypothetical protein